MIPTQSLFMILLVRGKVFAAAAQFRHDHNAGSTKHNIPCCNPFVKYLASVYVALSSCCAWNAR
ncbi:hypothetical protein PF005_g7228 [Phytophthora fragariae]|uniref:Secreted protein n=1 Tax=Phytophthora fragariae TaxID=53985 RepID=A0A6A3FC67_9STRA|nr:hypothetical protein PF003_g39769 [Phytophthora fragariae]KAE8942713.1 hypothetical protein PF009_g7546 [Phytophthora fragariae]KAE9019587.1 hypothetical protein PF011_g5768 [Phytophthora fragariae]KAE9122896.1 hypothetical protein PF007_g7268 [Phytophthora fragariae]KAE9125447.1 hypothetical protein PF010_g5619 [Phytophthora fragariae]